MLRSFGKRRLGADECGGATVEYALLLSIAVGGICLLGEAARIGFERVRGDLSGDSKGRVAQAIRPLDPLPLHAPQTSVNGAIAASPAARWDIPLLTIVLLFGCPVWYQIYRLRRGSRPAQAEAAQLAAFMDDRLPAKVFQKRQATLRFFSDNLATMMQSGVQVRHAMTRPAMSVFPSTPVEAVKAMMDRHTVRHILVCDKRGELVGVVSDRDVRGRDGKLVADRMTRSPLTVSPDTPIVPAITAMIGRGVSCLPVVHEGKCEGILTVTDVAITLQCLLHIMQRAAAGLQQSGQIENG